MSRDRLVGIFLDYPVPDCVLETHRFLQHRIRDYKMCHYYGKRLAWAVNEPNRVTFPQTNGIDLVAQNNIDVKNVEKCNIESRHVPRLKIR